MSTAVNPFSNDEKENFPDFDAVFKSNKVTPSNDQKGAFRWSIDQLATLKPIDIGTSPASLGHHLMSPCDDPQCQDETDKFFAQKLIHPSPWSLTKGQSKHVKFSPHPPSTTYFKKDSAHLQSSDASTQTVLSIPIDFDLEKLLGPAFYNSGEETSFSLRRKLFGEPSRQESDEEEDEIGSHGNRSPRPQHKSTASEDTQLSSTPLRSPFTPSDKGSCHDNVFASSFVTADHELPTSLSPISKNNQITPLKTTLPVPLLDFSPIMEEKEEDEINTRTTSEQDNAAIKPILKRHYHGSPHWPDVKHYCNFRPSIGSSSSSHTTSDDDQSSSRGETSPTEEGVAGVPALLSLGDLQSEQDETTPSTACTTYFNNMELADDVQDKPVDSLMASLWQPPINSTMVKQQHSAVAPPTDSGYIGGVSNSNDIHMSSFDKPTMADITDSSEVGHECNSVRPSRTDEDQLEHKCANFLPTKLPSFPSHLTPPSRYNAVTNATPPNPMTGDLIRRKNVLKAKLSIASLEKL